MKKERFAPWLKQPDGPVGINKGHPRADGLEFFAPLSGAHGTLDLVRSQLGTRTGLEAYLPAQNGALHHVFGGSNYASFTEVLSAIGTTTPITIAWTQEPRSTSGQSAVIDWQFGTGGTHPSFTVYQSASLSGYYFNVGPRGSGGGVGDSVSFSAAVGAVTNDKLDRYVLRCLSGVLDRTGAGYDLWRNGVQIAGTTDSANKFGWGTPSTMRIGSLSDGSDPFEGLLGDFRIWSRVLSDGDAEAESTLPEAYALYAPRRILVPVSAGGTASIDAAAGSATASTLSGASTAAATVGQATGAATASTIEGAATKAAAISSAAGASTASALTGASTAAAAASAAAGASTSSTAAGASTAAAAISAAAGASTASTLAGVTGTGANISAAAGAATASSMAGAATAEAAISAASGSATASDIAGASTAAAAISAASGATTASTLVGSTVGDASTISPAAGVASAQIIVGASFAAAAIGAASGSTNARTLTGSDGLIDAAVALARYTITAAPRLTTITAAARRLEINR